MAGWHLRCRKLAIVLGPPYYDYSILGYSRFKVRSPEAWGCIRLYDALRVKDLRDLGLQQGLRHGVAHSMRLPVFPLDRWRLIFTTKVPDVMMEMVARGAEAELTTPSAPPSMFEHSP